MFDEKLFRSHYKQNDWVMVRERSRNDQKKKIGHDERTRNGNDTRTKELL